MSFIDIVFAKSPDPNPDFRFVEVEDASGASVEVGTWLQRADGYWVLRLLAAQHERFFGATRRITEIDPVNGEFSLTLVFDSIDKKRAAESAMDAPTDYAALEREHLGDPDKKTGIYAERKLRTCVNCGQCVAPGTAHAVDAKHQCRVIDTTGIVAQEIP